MVRPDFARPVRNAPDMYGDVSYVAGGPIANIHEGIAASLLISTLPEWTAYEEAAAPSHDIVHLVSRVVGVLTLVAAVGATIAYLL